MPSSQELLRAQIESGLRGHSEGRIDSARETCQQALGVDPGNPEALNLLGTAVGVGWAPPCSSSDRGARSIGVPSHLAALAPQDAKITEIHAVALTDTRDYNKELSGR